MVGEQEEFFEELAYALVRTLDEWSRCLQEMLEGPGPSRPGLVARLRDAVPKIDNPLLGHWLLGRDQLLGANKRSGRLPTVQDTARIVAAFRDDAGAQRRRLMAIARRIEFHRDVLQKIRGHQWRSAVVNALRAPEQPNPPAPEGPPGSPETDLPPGAGLAARAVPGGEAAPGEKAERPLPGPTGPLPPPDDAPAPAGRRSWTGPTAVLAAIGLVIGLAIAVKGWPGAAERGSRSGPSGPSATSAAGRSAQPVDTLGGESRCSPPRTGPSGVRLRACVGVQPDRVVFVLKVDNPTASAAAVTVRLGGFWAGAAHDCQPGPAVSRVTVEPGTTFTTDPDHCQTARQDSPLAYQAEAYIATGDSEEWTGHTFSPRANVYPDRGTLWRCGDDVPC
ncbi:hypothetical protein [Streptomyces sp. TP-A0874]|uniref:hypothetical protein n=1 Tax=Streptomyces sp. TP-A0874 TaxID=549819 RepID=UPI000A7F93B8|nr:hypothetical protein [Streptomyces sp. TP-A0874]